MAPSREPLYIIEVHRLSSEHFQVRGEGMLEPTKLEGIKEPLPKDDFTQFLRTIWQVGVEIESQRLYQIQKIFKGNLVGFGLMSQYLTSTTFFGMLSSGNSIFAAVRGCLGSVETLKRR